MQKNSSCFRRVPCFLRSASFVAPNNALACISPFHPLDYFQRRYFVIKDEKPRCTALSFPVGGQTLPVYVWHNRTSRTKEHSRPPRAACAANAFAFRESAAPFIDHHLAYFIYCCRTSERQRNRTSTATTKPKSKRTMPLKHCDTVYIKAAYRPQLALPCPSILGYHLRQITAGGGGSQGGTVGETVLGCHITRTHTLLRACII